MISQQHRSPTRSWKLGDIGSEASTDEPSLRRASAARTNYKATFIPPSIPFSPPISSNPFSSSLGPPTHHHQDAVPAHHPHLRSSLGSHRRRTRRHRGSPGWILRRCGLQVLRRRLYLYQLDRGRPHLRQRRILPGTQPLP